MGLISYAMDRNRRGEVQSRFHYDENDDRMIHERVQDIEPIIKENQQLRSSGDGFTQDRSMVRVGQIPMIVIEKIMTEEGWDPLAAENCDRLHALLDNPDYAKFRTSEGKIARKPLRQYFRGSTGKVQSRIIKPLQLTKPVYSGDDE